MRRHRTNIRRASRRNGEQGIVIMLVAVVMLFVVGAMAALSIDVVTLYTARSEAQLAADAAALAGARVLANSGMTSAFTTAVGIAALPMATQVAVQVAASNPVGGRNLHSTGTCTAVGEICVNINTAAFNFLPNPQVTVQVQRTDLPTFFARIWGRTTIAVRATATAEAYNPSNVPGTTGTAATPVAPTCVKPWLLPNKDPSNGGLPIFNGFGNITPASTLITLGIPVVPLMKTACGVGNPYCALPPTPASWNYFTGAPADFPAPPATSVVCLGCASFNAYQLSIAGCVQPPIACNANVNIDNTTGDTTLDDETATAVNAMTHSNAGKGDSIDTLNAPSPPFQFLTGADNPMVLSGAVNPNIDVMVSDSLVTVPVFDDTTAPVTFPTVKLVGFVQLFLSPAGTASSPIGVQTQVINLVGCGAISVGQQPILGNGASPVVVRLISP